MDDALENSKQHSHYFYGNTDYGKPGNGKPQKPQESKNKFRTAVPVKEIGYENEMRTCASLPDFMLKENAVFSPFTGSDSLRSRATEIGACAQDNRKISKSLSLSLVTS